MWQELADILAPAHRRHHRHRRDHRALLPPRPRPVGGARQLGRGGQGVQRRPRQRLAQQARARVAGAGLLQQRAVAGAVRHLREDGRHRPRRRGHGRLLRAHGQDRAGRPRRPREGGRPVGPRHRPARRGSDRARRAGRTCTSAPSSGASSSTSSSGTVRITHEPQEQIPLYQRLGRIWGEKLHRERNALEAWQKVLEIDPTDILALRALAAIYKSTQAWEELVETLHKLIDIGTASRHGAERAHRAVRRARRAAGRDPDAPAGGDRRLAAGAAARRSRLPRARRARAAVHAGGALGRVHRRPRAEGAARSTTRRRKVEMLLQAASVWEDKIGDRDRAGDVYERILQLDAQNMTASLQLEQVYRAQGIVGEAHRAACSRASSSPAESAERVADPAEGRRDLRAGGRRPGGRVRRAPGGVPRELRRPGGLGRARAAGDGDQQVERPARRVHADRAADPRSGDGGGPVGQDRPLVRRAPRPPRLRHRLRAAGADAGAGEHRGAGEPGRLLPQEVDVVGAGGDARQARRARRRAGEEGRAAPGDGRAVGRSARRSGAGGRRLSAGARVQPGGDAGARRARAALSRHRSSGRI